MASALYMVKKDLPKNNRLDDRVPACAQICWFVRIHAAGVENETDRLAPTERWGPHVAQRLEVHVAGVEINWTNIAARGAAAKKKHCQATAVQRQLHSRAPETVGVTLVTQQIARIGKVLVMPSRSRIQERCVYPAFAVGEV